MFISKEKLEELIEFKITESNCIHYVENSSVFNSINERIKALEDYLGIHYEENTTKGYVKNKKK